MADELLGYYERELSFLRQMGAEFKDKYPLIAQRLELEDTQCRDPHVERMIDDEFPEITEALLSIVYPHFIRPIPSMTVVEMHTDPEQAAMTSGFVVPRGSVLNSRPVEGFPVRFRTCYNTTLWPFTVADAMWRSPDRLPNPVKAGQAVAALRIEFRAAPDVQLEGLKMDRVRLFLNGDDALVNNLYELLCNNCFQVQLRDLNPNSKRKPIILKGSALEPRGFADDEAMLPFPLRSFVGYRLLQEYFYFPKKFFFFDLTGLEELRDSGFQGGFEVVALISEFERHERREALEMGVSAKTIRMNCSPAVNLFDQTAEPILLVEKKTEYRVIPDVRRQNALEIYELTEVFSSNPKTAEVTDFEPFYSYRHGIRDRKQTFWHSNRRMSARRDDQGTDVYVTLVDLTGRPMTPNFDALTVRTRCSNRDLPERMPYGKEDEKGDLEPEGLAPIRRVVILSKPTKTIRPPVGKSALWRLISHLSLNYLSLVSEGKEAFQEILRLYDFSNATHLQKQIAGIVSIGSAPHYARVIHENGISYARGTRVDLGLDEDQFVGGGAYLFAAVVERFLAHYTTLNSFTQLVVKTKQRREVMREWTPRAGDRILV